MSVLKTSGLLNCKAENKVMFETHLEPPSITRMKSEEDLEKAPISGILVPVSYPAQMTERM